MEITVMGSGAASSPPTRGTVRLECEFEGESLDEILRDTTQLSHLIHEELVRLNDGPVTWFAVLPVSTRHWRPYSDSPEERAMRHAANVEVSATFRDFEALSRFIGRWGGHDGVAIRGVSWSVTRKRQRQLEQRALTRAVRAARRRARQISQAAGAGEVVFARIADPGLLERGGAQPYAGGPPRFAMAAGFDDGDADGGPLRPRDITVRTDLEAHFTASGDNDVDLGAKS